MSILKVFLILGAAALAYFGWKWYSPPYYARTPLSASEAAVQADISSLRSAVEALRLRTVSECSSIAKAVLSDDFLGIDEGNASVAQCLALTETLKKRAQEAAIADGFTFREVQGGPVSVQGFSFKEGDAQNVVETEFRERVGRRVGQAEG